MDIRGTGTPQRYPRRRFGSRFAYLRAMHSSTLSLLLLVVLTLSCGAEDPAVEPGVPDLSTALLGTWETVEYDVDYTTYLGSDTSYTEHITEAQWGALYGVRPPSTVFTADGKLLRTHKLRNGTVVNTVNGLWKQQGDSLFVIEPSITFTYYPVLDGQRLTLTGVVDQDRDGQRDDRFTATYRLVGRSHPGR